MIDEAPEMPDILEDSEMWSELREMSFEEPPETPSMVIEEVNEDNLED